jgi:hypothetical protein
MTPRLPEKKSELSSVNAPMLYENVLARMGGEGGRSGGERQRGEGFGC